MRDIPLLLLATTVSAYWFCVGVKIVRVKRKARHAVAERGTWIVWVPLVALWIALPWIALQATDAPWAVPALDGLAYAALRWVAAAVGIASLAITVRCWTRMGKDWRMDVSPDTKPALITDGPFSRIRHPIYAFSILLMISTAVVLPTWPMLVVAAIHIALMNVKARNEERHLLESHGDAYARYIERTGRFLPHFGAHGT
jgi:protein-S-isoprenylcysteine O-methyltransferase Ste14